jgi:replicative DNA helicase
MSKLDLEMRVMKAVVDHQRLAMDFAYSHNPKLFLDSTNKQLAGCMIDYVKVYRSKPTKDSLIDFSRNRGLAEEIDKFWEYTSNFTYDESDYNFDIEKLKTRYAQHIIGNLKSALPEEITNDIGPHISSIERTMADIRSLNKERSFEKKTLRQYVPEFKKEYTAKFKNPELGKGILTGYSCFDFLKNGLRPADLLIICGETGNGKSMFLNNMAINMWMQNNTLDTPQEELTSGFNVMYFTLEMPYQDCFRRTISQMADIPSYGIRDSKLNQLEAKAMAKALKFMERYPYEFDIIDVARGFTVDELELHFQEAKSRYTPDVIVIDYLGLMDNINQDGDAQDWLKLGELTGKVHEFSRTHQIPTLTAVQLNRSDKKTKKKDDEDDIGLHRIGRSNLIAHHASVVIQIANRKTEKTRPDLVYHIIKNRDGQLGSASILKNFAHSRIIDKPYDYESDEGMSNYLSSRDDISSDMANIINNIISGE